MTASQNGTNGASVPHPLQDVQTASSQPITASPYSFPRNKLKRRMSQSNKTPLVLVACGSFSPITALHIQMFEMSERYAEDSDFEVVGNYLSPVSDAYKKPALAPAHHRLMMCKLAVKNSARVMVDPWEALQFDSAGQPVYTRTVDVLRHFDHEINDVLGGILAPDGTHKRAQVSLLVGADVALTMSDPKSWAPKDLDAILSCFGAFVVERPAQTSIEVALAPLKKYMHRIWVVSSFYNDVSSTKIRDQIRNGKHENVIDLPSLVIEYIKSHDLYAEPLKTDGEAR